MKNLNSYIIKSFKKTLIKDLVDSEGFAELYVKLILLYHLKVIIKADIKTNM